jgi:hypothetical protein
MIHENETNNLSKAAAPLISNIVGSVDFSKRSTGAASFTLRMARRFDATIKLLHVEKPIERDTFSMVETMHWAKRNRNRDPRRNTLCHRPRLTIPCL